MIGDRRASASEPHLNNQLVREMLRFEKMRDSSEV
jgi:hypothetical protein